MRGRGEGRGGGEDQEESRRGNESGKLNIGHKTNRESCIKHVGHRTLPTTLSTENCTFSHHIELTFKLTQPSVSSEL